MTVSLLNVPIIVGVARTLDMTGALNRSNPYSKFHNPAVADASALAHDWRLVGEDMSRALATVAHDVTDNDGR